MTIFVDNINTYYDHSNIIIKKYGTQWCHMWCDGNEEELHELAIKIGLKRKYFQKHRIFNHYDLIPSKRIQAIKCGAIETSLRIWIKKNYYAKT